jgi:hypothetical protein
MSTGPTVDRVLEAQKRSALRWLWLSGLVVVLAGVGVVLWLVLGTDTKATISYDGTNAVYSGPSQLEAYPNNQTFRLVNNSDSTVDFAFAPVKADALGVITEQEAREWGLTQLDPPPWVGNGGHIAMLVPGGEIIEEADMTFTSGRTYEFVVWDRSQQVAHWVGWIETTE